MAGFVLLSHTTNAGGALLGHLVFCIQNTRQMNSSPIIIIYKYILKSICCRISPLTVGLLLTKPIDLFVYFLYLSLTGLFARKPHADTKKLSAGFHEMPANNLLSNLSNATTN